MSVTHFLPLKNALGISQCKGWEVKDRHLNRLLQCHVAVDTWVWSVGAALSPSSACRMGRDLLEITTWVGGRVLQTRILEGHDALVTYSIWRTVGRCLWVSSSLLRAPAAGSYPRAYHTQCLPSLPLFPIVIELWAALGRKGRGLWNPLTTLPYSSLGEHDLFQEYSSVYMSSCASTPNPNLVLTIFPGHPI